MITDLTARGTSASLWYQKKVGETVRTQTFWILISEVLIDDVQKHLHVSMLHLDGLPWTAPGCGSQWKVSGLRFLLSLSLLAALL